jgi:hypothetical protein
MEIKKEKKLYTINDCNSFDDIKETIEDIIDQYEIMQSRINDYEITRKSMTQAIEWFLNPVKSEGRKDD